MTFWEGRCIKISLWVHFILDPRRKLLQKINRIFFSFELKVNKIFKFWFKNHQSEKRFYFGSKSNFIKFNGKWSDVTRLVLISYSLTLNQIFWLGINFCKINHAILFNPFINSWKLNLGCLRINIKISIELRTAKSDTEIY